MHRTAYVLGVAVLVLTACLGAPQPGNSTRPDLILTPEPVASIVGDGGDARVAYIVNGDVWVRALPAGAAQQMTDDGLNSRPKWSPSGRYLAFLKDIELWTVDMVDGTGWAWASPVATFAWSPVDDQLAYVAGSGILRMMVADPATLRDRALIPPEVGLQGAIGRIAWRPDGQAITYEWRQGREHQSLRWVPAEGGESSELYVSGVPERGEAVLVGWASEDALLFLQGELLSASLLADGAPLYAVSVDDGAVSRLQDSVLTHADFAVLADGGRAFAVVAGAGRGTWSNKRLDVVDVMTGDVVTLSLPEQAATSPSWSPDGTRVAYAAMADRGDLVGGNTAREGLATRRIWIADAAGGEGVRVTGDAAYRDERPLWSGDGSSLLFVRMDADEGVSLWWLDLAVGEPVRVVDDVGPLPGPAEAWFGNYGHIDWAAIFDVWTPAR
jgi:dipeptidyl aminopeptidase/acylaminoacyl peptidase